MYLSSVTHMPFPKIAGIYAIYCTENKYIYIGQSANLKHRWSLHYSSLKRNIHANIHLQRSWNKYGDQSFLVSAIEIVIVPTVELLTELENKWMNVMRNANVPLFNLAPIAGSTLGIKQSEETKAKLRESLKNRPREVWIKSAQARIGIARPSTRKHYQFVSPEGRLVTIHGLQAFCKKHGLNNAAMQSVHSKKTKSYKGWRKYTDESSLVPYNRLAYSLNKHYIFVSPSGEKVEVYGLSDWCKTHNLKDRNMSQVHRRQRHSHHGWTKYIDESSLVPYVEKTNKGVIFSDDHKNKISQSLIGNKYALGYKHTLEARNKISVAHKGKTISLESRAKMSASARGNPKPSLEKDFTFVSPEGEIIYVHGLSRWCQKNNLNISGMSMVHSGRIKHHKGWTRYNPDLHAHLVQLSLFDDDPNE